MNLIDAARLTEAELDAVDSEILFDGESMRPIADLQLAKALWVCLDWLVEIVNSEEYDSEWEGRAALSSTAFELEEQLTTAGIEKPEGKA